MYLQRNKPIFCLGRSEGSGKEDGYSTELASKIKIKKRNLCITYLIGCLNHEEHCSFYGGPG